MPVKAEIRENGRVIYTVITDPWSAEEILNLRDRNWRIREQSLKPVHLLYNLRGTLTLPPKAISLLHGSPALEHRNSGQIVITEANDLVRSLIEVIATLSQTKKMKFFATEEEGWAYLRSIL